MLGQAISTRVGPAIVVGILPESYLGISEDDGIDYWLAEKQNNHPEMLTDRATILEFLGLKADALQSVRLEGTEPLPR